MGSDLTLATPWLPETFFLGRMVSAGKREEAGWNEQNCQHQTQAWVTPAYPSLPAGCPWSGELLLARVSHLQSRLLKGSSWLLVTLKKTIVSRGKLEFPLWPLYYSFRHPFSATPVRIFLIPR